MFKVLMKQSKVTQKRIAEELRVTQSLVSQWCSGKCEPKISQLKPISEILGVDVGVVVDSFCQEVVA